MNRSSIFTRPLRSALLAAGLALGACATVLAAGVLDRARDSSKLTFGYRADARPFAFADGGKPAGFSVALCQKVADAVQAELKLPKLQLDFVPVTATSRFELLQQGKIDLSCGTDTPTLARRGSVDFSLPIFFAGTGALLRKDADPRLRNALADQPDPVRPVWRGAPGIFGLQVVFAVVGGTTVEKTLIERLKLRRVTVTVAPVPDYAAGVQMVLDGRAAALFGDRPVLLDLAQRGAGPLQVIERTFTREPLALALPRGDAEFRLLVDRTLSRVYRSPEFAALYTTYFGAPGPGALEFFQAVALPD
ncbi:MAG TPA: amino acid ABC transporter substrate-binding protein [Rubrivivax sp.]|nr:amino acid ABC transporter substrate-binding protein [Rubrivivax sp.]